MKRLLAGLLTIGFILGTVSILSACPYGDKMTKKGTTMTPITSETASTQFEGY